jgi:hypothetical protein
VKAAVDFVVGSEAGVLLDSQQGENTVAGYADARRSRARSQAGTFPENVFN